MKRNERNERVEIVHWMDGKMPVKCNIEMYLDIIVVYCSFIDMHVI